MKKFFSMMLALMMVLSLTTIAWGEEGGTPPVDNPDDTIVASTGNVAKVGNTEYATIDEAIANWTHNTTLTLLADVTLSDVITLNSTEHHILDLGTYTMTAASEKDAFVIKACGTGSSERNALTINADTTNPGGINAGNKRVVYYKYADGGISAEDRPIIIINGGVFTGSTSSFGTAGIYTIGTAARKCATLNISGGTFNCSINGSGKSKLLISGGTFNYSVGSQGDSTCYRLISGGAFKTIGFMTADSNNTKFWIGTAMGNSNVGVHVNDTGYIVIGGPVITEPGTFEASSANYSGASSYLQYSSAKENGLYYTSVAEALADNNKTTGSVTVYVDELDMTGISYKGTIVVPEGKTLTITNAPAGLKTEGNAIVPYTVTFDVNGGEGTVSAPATIAKGSIFTLPDALTKDNYTFSGWNDGTDTYQAGASYTMPANAVVFTAQWTADTYTVTLNTNGGTITEGNVETYTYDTGATLPTPAKTGYTFAGWYANSDFSDTAVTEIATGSTGDKVYHAKWAPNTYTVTLNANEGTIAEGKNVTGYTYGEGAALPAAADMTKSGYTFAGWYEDAQFSGDAVAEISTTDTGDKTYYAKWDKIVYPSVDTPAFNPDEDVDVEDNTLNDAALAVGDAIENGDVKMEPAAGYTVEEIAKLQNEGKLNMVIQKKLSYDTTEKSLIDAAITKVGGSASQVDVVYIDVTPVLMTDDGTVVATITNTEKPLTITLNLSAEMQKAAEEGKFISVIRVHDGKVTFLDSKLNAEKTKITFTSSEFSTYAVVAMDKEPSANTFDAGIAMYGVMAVLAATGSAVIIKKRK